MVLMSCHEAEYPITLVSGRPTKEITMTFTPFRCECGTLVVWKTGPGRVSEYRRGVSLPVPEEFGIPTCPKCGEQYLTVKRGAELTEAQRPAYEAWQREQCEPLINSIRQRHSITLRQLESVCGVSATYLSKVLHSKREVSTTLLRLLEALDRHPSEVERHLKRPTHARAWVDSAAQGTNL